MFPTVEIYPAHSTLPDRRTSVADILLVACLHSLWDIQHAVMDHAHSDMKIDDNG